jgi:hypothetical protein
MVAMAQLIPEDPKEQASVLEVLREHPELTGFIAKASTKAEEFFPGATMHLDTVRYDEWDPPISLFIDAPVSWPDYKRGKDEFIRWLVAQPDFDIDLILAMPRWTGDLATAQ